MKMNKATKAAAVVPKQPKKTASAEKRDAVMDIFESFPPQQEENLSSVPSPGIAVPNGPSIHPNHLYILEFDGGSRGNPTGSAGAGMVLYDTGPDGHDKQEVWVGWEYLGHGQMTNNQAEYTGLIGGLEAALARGIRKITVLGDSDLIIKHIRGEYKVRSDKLRPLWKKAMGLLNKFDSYEMRHIYRHHNSRADGLANLAMDELESGSSD